MNHQFLTVESVEVHAIEFQGNFVVAHNKNRSHRKKHFKLTVSQTANCDEKSSRNQLEYFLITCSCFSSLSIALQSVFLCSNHSLHFNREHHVQNFNTNLNILPFRPNAVKTCIFHALYSTFFLLYASFANNNQLR